MNRLYSSHQSGKSDVRSESLMVVLGLVALFQIALCFNAGSHLVGANQPPRAAIRQSSLETNAPLVRAGNTASNEKLSSFQFATTHR